MPHFQVWDIARSVMDWGWCPQDRSSIQYAMATPAQARSFINGLGMHDGTGTHYAMKYALATLDPATGAWIEPAWTAPLTWGAFGLAWAAERGRGLLRPGPAAGA